jgi:tetratricopeptide (TPR) repeat protein
MNSKLSVAFALACLLGLVFSGPEVASAQGSSSQSGQEPASQSGSQSAPAAAPAMTEEDTAAKAFQTMPVTSAPELEKKIAAGEEFLKKYPESRYRSAVYSSLAFNYLQDGKAEKAMEIGDKEVALKPDDVQTLALLSQTITRSMNSSTPEPDKQLTKAEGYAKRAIEVTPTLPKPEGVADQNFIVAKNATLSMAHSGLGLVYFRRQKYSDAIPELEQSIKIDPNPSPDPVNLYLLGMADQKASRFDDAAMVFSKCAVIPGQLQAACKNGTDEAKKQGATQLSAPK